MLVTSFLLLSLLLGGDAQAFCGTYVGSAAPPVNRTSAVAIVRNGTRTTLTLANDVHGDTSGFALVIPVPELLAAEAVHVLDRGVFERLDRYSAPRLVRYDCDDLEATRSESDTDTDTDSDTDTDTDHGVSIEAEYVVGEYDIQLLSAEASAGLVTWLQENGYSVPDSSADLLGTYIEAGNFFLTAQVREDAGIQSGELLSPLQLSYTAAGYSLPVRLGTLNSDGEQDLLVYVINNSSDGPVGISNYPQATLESDCMLPEGVPLDEHLEQSWDKAFSGGSRARWVREFAWGNGDCDPCTATSLSAKDLTNLGFLPDYHLGYNYHFTRLHLRFGPASVDQDLVLYNTGYISNEQLRYIQYDQRLESEFPVCGRGFLPDPGTCDDVPDDRSRGMRCGGCAEAGPSAGLWLVLAGGLGLRWRRR